MAHGHEHTCKLCHLAAAAAAQVEDASQFKEGAWVRIYVNEAAGAAERPKSGRHAGGVLVGRGQALPPTCSLDLSPPHRWPCPFCAAAWQRRLLAAQARRPQRQDASQQQQQQVAAAPAPVPVWGPQAAAARAPAAAVTAASLGLVAADAPAPWAGTPGAWALAPDPEQYPGGRDVAAQQLDEPLSDQVPDINLNIVVPPDSVQASGCAPWQAPPCPFACPSLCRPPLLGPARISQATLSPCCGPGFCPVALIVPAASAKGENCPRMLRATAC